MFTNCYTHRTHKEAEPVIESEAVVVGQFCSGWNIRKSSDGKATGSKRGSESSVTKSWLYLDELFKIGKENLVIDCESVAFVLYAVVLNARVVADGEGVVSGVSDAGSEQEQTVHRRLQKFLCFLAWNFNMQPSRTERNARLPWPFFVFTLTSSSRFLKKPSSSMVSWLSR